MRALRISSLEKKVKALAFWGDERKVRREMAVGVVTEERAMVGFLSCGGFGGGEGFGRFGAQDKVGGGLAAAIVRKAMIGSDEIEIWIWIWTRTRVV